MLLVPSAELFVCVFIFVAPRPLSLAEVKGQGQFRNSSSSAQIRRAAHALPLRPADIPATKLQWHEVESCFGLLCRESFVVVFFSFAGVFVFPPLPTGLTQEGPTGTGRGTLPQCSTEGHVNFTTDDL